MRYSITSQQFNHFKETGQLELEGLYSEQELDNMHKLIETALQTNPSGRDIQRQDLPLSKALYLKRLGQVVTELFHKKRIKLGLTQVNPSFVSGVIGDFVCVSDIIGSATISFSSENKEKLVFSSASTPLELSDQEEPFLILVFVKDTSRYIHNERDPHLHILKKLGYGFGDNLTQETHPIITTT